MCNWWCGILSDRCWSVCLAFTEVSALHTPHLFLGLSCFIRYSNIRTWGEKDIRFFRTITGHNKSVWPSFSKKCQPYLFLPYTDKLGVRWRQPWWWWWSSSLPALKPLFGNPWVTSQRITTIFIYSQLCMQTVAILTGGYYEHSHILFGSTAQLNSLPLPPRPQYDSIPVSFFLAVW